MKEQVLEIIDEHRIFAISRAADPGKMTRLAHALFDGGIRAMELTLDQKNADERAGTLKMISALAKEMKGRMIIGAGTVLSAQQARLAAEAGAQFIVAPSTDASVIEAARELSLVAIPGGYTPTEIMTAHNAGADYVKLFPADEMGVSYIKSVCAPISHVKLMAVGNVNTDTLGAYMDAGCFGAGVGGSLVNKKRMAEGRFDLISEYAAELVSIVKAHI